LKCIATGLVVLKRRYRLLLISKHTWTLNLFLWFLLFFPFCSKKLEYSVFLWRSVLDNGIETQRGIYGLARQQKTMLFVLCLWVTVYILVIDNDLNKNRLSKNLVIYVPFQDHLVFCSRTIPEPFQNRSITVEYSQPLKTLHCGSPAKMH